MFALNTPLPSTLKLEPTLTPPNTEVLAVGNVYAEGIVGLLDKSL